MKEKFIFWSRWICLLPGSLLAAILILFPVHWFLYMVFKDNGIIFGFIEFPPQTNLSVENAIAPFIVAITFIFTAFKIAPKYKLKVAFILTILWLCVFASIFIFMRNYQPQLQLKGVGSILGSLLALFIAYKKQKYEFFQQRF